MAEEIGFENGRNSNFEGLVTLTLDPAIRHTVVHHSSTSTCIPNFIEIEETFCGRTDGRTYGRTYGHSPPPLILLGRLLEVDLKNHRPITAECPSCNVLGNCGQGDIITPTLFIMPRPLGGGIKQ